MNRTRWACRLVLALALAPGSAAATDWYVLCDVATGEVRLEGSKGAGLELLAGPFPGMRTAGLWVQEHHPDGRCTARPEPTVTPPPVTFPAAGSGPWIVVCANASGTVEMVQGSPPPGSMVLWGVDLGIGTHPDRAAATAWTQRACPSWRCDGSGRCLKGPPRPPPTPVPARWRAGELVSTVRPLPSLPATGTRSAARVGDGEVLGPGTADLSPLVATATEAAASCAYPAALAAADHLSNFDDHHPWLVANRDTLERLAHRQQATERAALQASEALRAGQLDAARELAGRAADTAISCQTRVVSQLLTGIDTAIEQEKAARDANRRRAAAALLPGLIDLAGLIGGAQSGAVQANPATVSAVASSLLPEGVDLCAHQLEYRDPASVLPTCTCPGYVFDATRFRCVR